MVQIVPQRDIGEILGGGFGTGLGAGLGTGLQSLIQRKLRDMQAIGPEEQIKGLTAIGFTPEEAPGIAALPPQIQREIVKARLQEPRERAFAESLSAILGAPESTTPEAVEIGTLSAEQAAKLAQLGMQRQALETKEKATAFKETSKIREKISDEAKTAKENQIRLSRMERLNESGRLIPAAYESFLQKFNLDMPALKNPESQEFEKLSTDMMRRAREMFGARVTNFEIQTFLKTIPTLSQTKEGRQRVINNLKIMNEAAILKEQKMRDIIKKNRGIPPYDIRERIEEETSPEIDRLAEQLIMAPISRPKGTKEKPLVKKGRVLMKDPSGNLRSVPETDVEKAKEAGYEVQE